MTNITLTSEMQDIYSETQGFTGGHMYITGKAGTGKTTLLKYLVRNSGKKVVVAASTGVAAVNAGGQTLHSLFMVPFGPLPPGKEPDDDMSKARRSVLRGMELLIIDEVSMVRPDVLDFIDARLRQVRKSDRPFGGVQLVMFGDLYQLPPVVKPEELEILAPWYDSPYFFSARVWHETGFRVHELTKVFRQTDQDFVDTLNRIRDYRTSDSDIAFLSEIFRKPVTKEYSEKCVHLCTHKKTSEYINNTFLGKTGLKTYTARISGKFPEANMTCLKTLTLRVGARVMCITNNPAEGYYNGSLGIVEALAPDSVTVKLDTGKTVDLEEMTWENKEYQNIGDIVISGTVGTCTQIPVIPAWAITIHKSQGLTFDNVFLHVENIFNPGQLYVALSRCRSFEGLRSDSPITKGMILSDSKLLEFDETLQEASGFWYRGE